MEAEKSQLIGLVNMNMKIAISMSFPMAQWVKNPPAMQETQETQVQFLGWEDTLEKEMDRISTPVFLPGKFHGQRSLVGYSPKGHKELETTDD